MTSPTPSPSPTPTPTPTPMPWRRAEAADAVALLDLERDGNLVALRHVFGDLPFPADGVLARWALILDDPEVVIDVVDAEAFDGDTEIRAGGLAAFAAHDGESLRHLGVHPAAWGRGLGAESVARAVAAGAHRLWVLELNTRARALYERLGWAPSGITQECPWEPYPTELEYQLV